MTPDPNMVERVARVIISHPIGENRAKPSTYVLILKPAEPGGWPAVVGGYPTREQADAAGREATMADLSDEIEEKFDGIAPIGNAKFHAWRWRSWIAFTVIPGAAQC